MGFRIRKTFQVLPGVRMTLSKSGIGYSVGVRGARLTRTARGQVVGTIGIPGTGLSYVKTLRGSAKQARKPAKSTAPVQAEAPEVEGIPAPPQPALFAPRAEKRLYRALISDPDPAAIAEIGADYPEWEPLCAALDGLLAYRDQDFDRAEESLAVAFDSGRDAARHPFIRRYAPYASVELELAPGVEVMLPISREAVGLTLAELYQYSDRLGLAIETVEQLEPTFSAAVSLAELYSEAGHHDEVVEMTNGLAPESDGHALLMVLRGRALKELDYFEAAREVLKQVVAKRTVDVEIRHRALLERANTYLAERKIAYARKDLQRILAEDATYPGLAEALKELDAAS
ncbi:MAG: DUF4236 domain-containing protein [Hamadaea sp.]|uniref:DUF4236 domain-containing protein n=1 Tax=Hamadaea sp. TaxID=2024425 RepID=UPI0018552547|nr:DUF4236 domain-containing protein [Hamadaea sp.]NUR73839.1 DUF4236 domain-containing protein [Hamadaea sp.]NUT18996.1 DUF4236 domain-containing protein [Hamadaea sp.]